MDEIVELLLEHFATHAHSIGFPELAFPCVVKVGTLQGKIFEIPENFFPWYYNFNIFFR